MQQVSSSFNQKSLAGVRKLNWEVRASFDKAIDPDITFFIADVSLADGPDLAAPNDYEEIQQWDKFLYESVTDRLINIEVTREVLEPYSIVQSMADITLDNHDNYFTPGMGSPIDGNTLLRRPWRLFLGFGGSTVPVFVGLNTDMPQLDKESRTVKFHLIDFLSYIFKKEVGQTVLLEDASTAEILDELFQGAGLLSSQYDLDPTSFNRVSFFYVEKGEILENVVNKLMEVEQGRLYLDELGIIRFRNRQNYGSTPVRSLNSSSVINYSLSDEDDIINTVTIDSSVLGEMPPQSVWELPEKVYIRIGDTAEVWADLEDPVTEVLEPLYSPFKTEDSYFSSTTDSEGEIPYTDIELVDVSVFAKTAKLTFENTGSQNAYLTEVDLWGTPVKVVDRILVEDNDPDSVEDFEEKPYKLVTNYIQKRSNAISKAAVILDDYSEYGSIVEMDVKGTPALQIDDVLDMDLDGYQGNYVITKISQGINDGRYWQRLIGKRKDPRLYFVLDQSELDGSDVLVP